jgi:TolB-like protein/Tfp pilus assembly protein PilF
MGKDRTKAMDLVHKSKEIQKPLVERYNGKWLKEIGDGALAQFNSALDAVNCAIEIQEKARAKFEGKLRIGIHSGDITIENNDVYGDGVNIASRLESITDPGGIYVSESIEKAIRGQSSIQAKYLGEIKLKNVDYGVRTYALQGVGLPIPQAKKNKELSGHFIAELNRRGVFRTTLVYLGLCILLYLLLPLVNSVLTVPEWSHPVFLTLLIVGLPISIYLSWTYERSPEGIVRTTSEKSWQNPYSAAQRKPMTGNILIGALWVIVFFLTLYPKISGNLRGPSIAEENKSIAVLAFDDLSPNKDQEYLGDGIAEEVLNVLAKIKGLKVIGRTSSFSYKGKNTDLKTIGQELGVTTILEGSVRKDGNQIRITAQLINAKDGSHIWSETYDRELKNIFKIQDELSQSIAQKLFSSLNMDEVIDATQKYSGDEKAYELYLLGKHYQRQREDISETGLQAIKLLKQVVQIDDSFINAYAELAAAYYLMGFFGFEVENENIWEQAEYNAKRALDLDENNAIALRAMGNIKRTRYWDWPAARDYFRRSLTTDPNSGETLRYIALLMAATNQLDSAKFYVNKGLELNPLDQLLNQTDARLFLYERKYHEADMRLNKVYTGISSYLVEIKSFANKDQCVSLILDSENIEISSREDLWQVYRNQGWASFIHEIYKMYEEIFLESYGIPAGINGARMIFMQGAPIDIVYENLYLQANEKIGYLIYILVDPIYDPIFLFSWP